MMSLMRSNFSTLLAGEQHLRHYVTLGEIGIYRQIVFMILNKFQVDKLVKIYFRDINII